jgi:Uma2 family endonuclease
VVPNDLYEEVDEKVDEWLAAGVPIVWVVNPRNRTVKVHRPDGETTKLDEQDELTADAIVPGFHCRVGVLFPPSPGA